MGTIRVIGKSVKKVTADCCDIRLNMSVTRKTSAEAAKASDELCERLLKDLSELGFEPSKIKVGRDSIDRNSRYNSNEINFDSRREIWLYTVNDIKIVNRVRRVIERGYDNVEFSTKYTYSNEKKTGEEVLMNAINDSRRKAEILAESIGTKIIGVDKANLSGTDDDFDEDDEFDEFEEIEGIHKVSYRGLAKSIEVDGLSDELKPIEISIEREISIIWLTE